MVNATVHTDREGKFLRGELFFKDITERKRAEEKIKESEEKYRDLYEEAPNAYLSIDPDSSIIRCNRAAEKLLGYSSDELLKMKVLDLYAKTENGLEKTKNVFQRFLNNEIIRDEQLQMKHKNGEHLWISLSVKPILDKEGNIIESRSMLLDIGERKKAEQKLKESEEKFRNFTEQSFTGISIVQDNLFKYVNRTLAEIFGFTSDEILNLQQGDFIKLVHPEDRDLVIEQLNKRQLGDLEVINNYQFRGIRKNGDIIWLDVFGKTINYEGSPASYATLIDITEKKKIEEIKSKLLTRFSHEFKTPLVSINGYIDLLINEYRESFDSETMSILKEAKEGSTRLKQLINLFIESSKLEEKLVKVTLVEDNLYDLIKLCLNELKGLIQLRAQTINLDLREDLTLMFDREKLKEVISNLLVNSVKYTQPGGNIEIKSRIEDNFIVISIMDNGIGLTEDEKLQLFTQFGKIERYGQGWNVLSEGSGMGLYISKELIELHGGKIWAESAGRDQGSKFSLSLPLKR